MLHPVTPARFELTNEIVLSGSGSESLPRTEAVVTGASSVVVKPTPLSAAAIGLSFCPTVVNVTVASVVPANSETAAVSRLYHRRRCEGLDRLGTGDLGCVSPP